MVGRIATRGRRGSRNRKLKVHALKSKLEAESKQEIEWDYKCLSPTPSDVLPPVRLHFLDVLQLPKQCHQVEHMGAVAV